LRRWIDQGALEHATSKAVAAAKPKSEVALASIVRGRPAGAPPMPTALPGLAAATPRPTAVTALAASPWAPLLAVAGPKEVLLLDADSLAPLGALPFTHGQINVLKFSRNGQLLLAGGGRGGKAGKVSVWNVTSGKLLIEVGDEHDAVLAADISADQTQVALGGPGKIIRIYSTADGSLVREIKKHTDWVTAVEFSPDGVLLATGDRSAGLFVWEAHTGREYFGLRGHKLAITDLAPFICGKWKTARRFGSGPRMAAARSRSAICTMGISPRAAGTASPSCGTRPALKRKRSSRSPTWRFVSPRSMTIAPLSPAT
jgi:hypothetical protein